MQFLCPHHKSQVVFVTKKDFNTLCFKCVVALKLDHNSMVVIAQFIKEKREELRNLFLKNIEIIKQIEKKVADVKHKNFH